MRFIWSSFGIVLGVLLLKYTFLLTNFFGKFDWAEKYFTGGLGGTYFFYKLAGILLIILSAMYMFGILDTFLAPFGKFFGTTGR